MTVIAQFNLITAADLPEEGNYKTFKMRQTFQAPQRRSAVLVSVPAD